jgi:chromosomal replication initiation ATPase DnaA
VKPDPKLEAKLQEIFKAEYTSTSSLEAAARAVVVAVDAVREDDIRLEHANSRGRVSGDPLTRIQVDHIEGMVAQQLGIPLGALRAGAARICVEARWVAASVMRALGLSLPQIARAMQMPDHTRALMAVRKVNDLPDLAGHREHLLERLRQQGWIVPHTCARRATPSAEHVRSPADQRGSANGAGPGAEEAA